MQRKIVAITSAFALAFPASAAAGDDLQVGSQSNTTKQSSSSSATAKSGPVVVIGNKNHVGSGNNVATGSASNNSSVSQSMDQWQGGGDGDSLQVGSQVNKTVQDAKCNATASSGPIVIIGDKNHVKTGNNSASCSAKNESDVDQDMDQSQGDKKADKKGKKAQKKADKENKKGNRTQVGSQDNTTKQDAKCYADAKSGEVVVIGRKNDVKSGDNTARCEAKNDSDVDQDLGQDQD